jgi:hypothetical protein
MTDVPTAPSAALKRPSRLIGALLWFLAVLMMLGAVIYQRRTGPTYPKRGELVVAQQSYAYKLIRSEYTSQDARVLLPDPGPEVEAVVHWKRYKTADAFQDLPMARATEDGKNVLSAELPRQPAAGKLEYYLTVKTPAAEQRIPSTMEDGKHENVVIRFKDDVPAALLFSHVGFMFFAVLIGMRAGLAAAVGEAKMRTLAWVTFIGMTVGGMVLGPFVQKYAFGEYWTGFPWGFDLTDNKMLIMWVAWLLACSTIGLRPKRKEGVGRVVVLIATVVMMVVYLIPHSMRGSELDYGKLEQGVDPKDAIGTGD